MRRKEKDDPEVEVEADETNCSRRHLADQNSTVTAIDVHVSTS